MRTKPMRVIVGVVALATAISTRADEPPGRLPLFARHHQQKEGTPPPGRPRCIPHKDERAGFPRELAGHLQPTNTPGGIGYYVGGGVPAGHARVYADGACRRRDEGTWGWDETGGVFFRHRVILGWSHGRRYQGGTGAYRTDGPVVPDLIYATTTPVNSIGRREENEAHDTSPK